MSDCELESDIYKAKLKEVTKKIHAAFEKPEMRSNELNEESSLKRELARDIEHLLTWKKWTLEFLEYSLVELKMNVGFTHVSTNTPNGEQLVPYSEYSKCTMLGFIDSGRDCYSNSINETEDNRKKAYKLLDCIEEIEGKLQRIKKKVIDSEKPESLVLLTCIGYLQDQIRLVKEIPAESRKLEIEELREESELLSCEEDIFHKVMDDMRDALQDLYHMKKELEDKYINAKQREADSFICTYDLFS